MTAYLRRGDKIHLMMPISTDMSPREQRERAEADTAIMKRLYANMGVELSIITSSGNKYLSTHTVVAVFRDGCDHECEVCKDGP